MYAAIKDRNHDMAMAPLYMTAYGLIPLAIMLIVIFGVIGIGNLDSPF